MCYLDIQDQHHQDRHHHSQYPLLQNRHIVVGTTQKLKSSISTTSEMLNRDSPAHLVTGLGHLLLPLQFLHQALLLVLHLKNKQKTCWVSRMATRNTGTKNNTGELLNNQDWCPRLAKQLHTQLRRSVVDRIMCAGVSVLQTYISVCGPRVLVLQH